MEEQMNESEIANHFPKIFRSSQDSAYGSLSLNSNMSHCWSLSEQSQVQLSSNSLASGYFKPDNCQGVQLPSNIRNTDNKLVFGQRNNQDNEQKKRRFKPLMSKQLNTNTENPKNKEKSFKISTETKSLQVAALSQALGFIDKFRQTQESKTDKSTGPNPDELYDLALNLQEAAEGVACTVPEGLINTQQTTCVSKKVTEVFANECIEKKAEDAFCSAVSLHDGLVVHTTSTITDILGYPKDMWMGRSFIDFIHPEDRLTFTSQIGSGITLPLVENGEKLGKKNVGTCFCRIRKYNGLKSGCFAVKQKKTTYEVFKLSVCFKNIDSGETNADPSLPNTEATTFGIQAIFLFITAIPVSSAYAVPYDEGPFSHEFGSYNFTTKHDVDCTFSMVEESSISFLGFLPQDLHGQDIFKFYHPLDLPILKEAFEAVTTEQGIPFRSKPYRFKVRNEDYIILTTEFCSFINPWSRQLEFIIGKHSVLKGPKDPNIFTGGDMHGESETDTEINAEILDDAKLIEDEMKHLLSMPVHRKLLKPDDIYHNSSKRRKELTNFMETLLDQMAKYENKKKEGIITENNTVVLEEVSSPEGSVETPPSYNQLNYNENITRFFNSQPKTLTEKEVMEEKKSDNQSAPMEYNVSSVEVEQSLDTSNKNMKYKEGRQSSRFYENQTTRNTDSPGGTGESSSIRVGLSVGNQGQTDHGMSQDGTCSGHGSLQSGNGKDNVESYKSLQLTEEILQVHNKGMEKKMIEHYKETRKGGELRFLKKKSSSRYKSMSYNEIKKHNPSKSYDKTIKGIKYIQSKKGAIKNQTGRKEIPQDDNRFSWALFDNNSGSGPANFNYSDNVIGVPAFYISAIPPASQFVEYSTQPGMMVQTGPAYIPFATIPPEAMGQRFYPSFSSVEPEASHDHESRIHQKKVQHSQNLQQASDKMSTPKGCIVESHGTTKSKNVKFLIPSPSTSPQPRDHISVKVEPGSALDSDASMSMTIIPKKKKSITFLSDNDLGQRRDSGNGSNGSKYNSLAESDSSPENGKSEICMWKVKGKVRPVLSEPFWNDNVKVNDELLFNYQLEVHDTPEVLCEDMEKLKMMSQSNDINDQLQQLYKEVNRKGEDLFESDSETTEDDRIDESKINKIMKSDDMINIFHEDDAPFPTTPVQDHQKHQPAEEVPTGTSCETSDNNNT